MVIHVRIHRRDLNWPIADDSPSSRNINNMKRIWAPRKINYFTVSNRGELEPRMDPESDLEIISCYWKRLDVMMWLKVSYIPGNLLVNLVHGEKVYLPAITPRIFPRGSKLSKERSVRS